jgi:hypothetical protein
VSETLHPSLEGLDDCGCCTGTTSEVPAVIRNAEGLDRIAYRSGTHAEFKRSMLAALSEADRAPLHGLATRADDDFTVALLDAWATAADVLTFYQGRLAHESYLRTATEQGSVLRLARLIGYEPKSGVAAAAWLAFRLEEAPGAPPRVTIPAGVKVQSVPGQGEKPQTFETGEAIEARVEWNAMRPRVAARRAIQAGDLCLYLRGTVTQLQPGDVILIVGNERDHTPGDARWSARVLVAVTPDTDRDLTVVTFNKPLDAGRVPQVGVRVFALRQRASLFGHNAPDPALITKPDGTALGTWPGFENVGPTIELDSAYPKIVAGSWVILVGGLRGTNLYKASNVSFPSLSSFGISGKATRIKPDTADGLDFFQRRETIVYAQSEPLAVADPPLTACPGAVSNGIPAVASGTLQPVQGTQVTLDRQVAEIPAGRTLIVTGKRLRALVTWDSSPLTLTDDTGTRSEVLVPEGTLIVVSPPVVAPGGGVIWRLRHDDGFDGMLATTAADLVLVGAREDDADVSERVTVASCAGSPTEITFQGAGLRNLLDRATVTIAGNVAPATQGETVEEVAGSGDATRAFQAFTLRQAPLTHVRVDTPSGMASTLEVRVDNLLWREVRSLYRRDPDERVYVARLGDEGKTTVHFGDGRTGSRLPTGQQNVRLRYRKGSGLEGMVRAGQLTQLLTRPLSVREVSNPLPAEGADDPESLADARQNAPLTVTTLDRVVSLRDYEDFARSYPGIAKALATWTWDGRERGVMLTVAGPKGAAVEAGGTVASSLVASLRGAGDPFVPLRVETYRPAFFEVGGTVRVHPDHEADKVLAAAREALRARFSFESRRFGQPVTIGEVLAAMHAVAGVVAVDLDHLQRTDHAEPLDPAPRLLAELPAGGAGEVEAAELLLLAPGSLGDLGAAS